MVQKVSKKLFLFIVFLFFSLSLSSQEIGENKQQTSVKAEDVESQLDTVSSLSEDQKEIVQNFSWDDVEYISKYSFIIEMFDEKTNEYLQFNEPIDTIENKVSLILPYGKYRYKIEVYNILELFEYETEWYYTEIIQTYQPELRDVTPRVIYLDEEQDGLFTLSGSQLRPDTIFELINARSFGNQKIQASLIEEDDRFRRVRIKIDPTLFDSGTYKFKVTNNGGLNDTFSTIKIQYKKVVDFNVSVGFSPVFILFDDLLSSYLNNNKFFPFFGNIRLTFIPIKKRVGYFGVSLFASYGTIGTSLIPSSDNSFFAQNNYKITSGFLNSHLDFTYQKFLYKRKLVLDLHIGVGIMGFMNMKFKFTHDYESTPYNALNLTANGGLSLQYYILKRLYLECGCDFTYTFTQIFNKSKLNLGFIQPTLQVGWQL